MFEEVHVYDVEDSDDDDEGQDQEEADFNGQVHPGSQPGTLSEIEEESKDEPAPVLMAH